MTTELSWTCRDDFKSNTLADLTATEFVFLFRKGQISALEYARACSDRIGDLNSKYYVFEAHDGDDLEKRAADVDARADKLSLPMSGVPIGVKDNINTYDYPTGRGSATLSGYTPGNDARVVSNLRLAGSVIAGKTVTAEFGVHHPGRTLYPFDLSRTPGTSSSGSAVAVATRMVPVALGTQTGGSIVRPASYCGIMGYKPSFGLLPRTGVLKTTDTLDTVGFMARSVDDLQMIFEVCRVRGRNYPVIERGLQDPMRNSRAEHSWRVGVVLGPKTNLESDYLRQQLAVLSKHISSGGCQVQEYRLPDIVWEAHDLHDRIYCKALSYYLKEEHEWKPELFSSTLTEMLDAGVQISAEQYHRDTARQAEISALIDNEMSSEVDILIDLSTASEAPIGLNTRDVADHNLIWTMCGLPVISLPLLRGENGLPVGVSIVGRKYSDYLLFEFARHLGDIL